MKSVSKKLSIIGFLTLATMQSASAGEWSMTVFGGQTKADGFDELCRTARLTNTIRSIFDRTATPFSCKEDDSDSAIGLNLAYNFNQTFGMELGYVDLGEYTLELSGIGNPENITVDAKAPYIAGVATLGLTEKLSASGRLGAFKASGNVSSFIIGGSEKITGDEQAYIGASLDYKISKSVTTQLRYDNFDEFNILGLGIKFGF